MVSFSVPSGQLPLKPKSPVLLNDGAAAQSSSPSSKQSSGKFLVETTRLLRMYSGHRRSFVSAEFRPDLEHEVCGEGGKDSCYEEFARDRKRSKVRDSIHAVSSQRQSQLLSTRDVGFTSSPALTRDLSDRFPEYGEDHDFGLKNSSEVSQSFRRSSPTPLSPLNEASPLGLTLRKTPSLLDLISFALEKGSSAHLGLAASDEFTSEGAKNGARTKCLVPALVAADKLKASNFPASSLKVGTWERVSRYEGDLVGKCYYAKKKLVWEVLENSLKSKIEIQWGDISAMKASCPENLPGTLEIEVSRAPLFFRETNPQPRKHTLWQATSDFTGGQATLCNRHSLQFPEGVLNRHYEKLVQCDPRLKGLVEGPHVLGPIVEFQNVSWLYDSFHHHQPSLQSMGYDSNSQHPDFPSQMAVLDPSLPVAHARLATNLKRDVSLVKVRPKDSSSPSSVMDAPPGCDEGGGSDTEDTRPLDDGREHGTVHLIHPCSRITGVKNLPDVKPFCSNLYMIGQNAAASDQKTLDEIAQVLFGEPESVSFDEQSVMLAANSAEDFHLLARISSQASSQETEFSDGPNHLHTFSRFQVKSEMGLVDDQLAPMGSLAANTGSNGRLPQKDPSFNSLLSCFGKLGSAGDLLLHLPRVASFPQLFESPSHVSSVNFDPTFSKSYMGSEKLR